MTSLRILLAIGIACLCVQFAFGQTFFSQCVDAHNKYRALHGVPNLSYNGTLTADAQIWAIRLLKAGTFEHRPNNKNGENLYAISSSGTVSIDCAAAVKLWYDEISQYNFNNPGFSSATGHFTQVVWKSTTQVGCGSYKNEHRAVVVCNYYPPGNVIGQFAQNVLKN